MGKRIGWMWQRRCPRERASTFFRGIHNSVTVYETIGGLRVPVGERCLGCKATTRVPRFDGDPYAITDNTEGT